MASRQIYIAWVAFQRRAVSMQPHFGYDLKFIGVSSASRYLRPFEYIVKAFKSLYWIFRCSPSVVWVQLPPTIVLHLLFAYKAIFNRKCFIVADCHNATFRKPWIDIPGSKQLLEHCDLVLVHNEDIGKQVLQLVNLNRKLQVLEDPPARFENNLSPIAPDTYPKPWVICPCSFNKDEPIQAIIEAARQAPEITFVLTGNQDRALGNHDLSNLPCNVKLPGFLPTDVFDKLFSQATAVMGLTLLDGIQLSVANEAVGFGKAMILANTNTLKKLFYKGAIYVDPQDSRSIATGCREAIANNIKLTTEVHSLKTERQSLWNDQAQRIKDFISID